MSAPRRSPEECLEAIRAVEQYGNVTAAARALGVARTTLQYAHADALSRAARGEFGRNPVIPGFEMTKVSSHLSADGKLVSEHIQQRPARTETYELPPGHRVKAVSALVDASGKVVQQWMKTTETEISTETIVESVKEAISGYTAPPMGLARPKNTHSELLSVYPLVDWHIGLLAWSRETGEDFDLRIARSAILDRMGACIDATEPSETGIVLGIGDMLHFDGYEPVTSRSQNFLDADGRYPKVLRTALDMIFATIDLALRRHRRVLARILPGNHDARAAIALSTALWVAFRGHKRVTVDDSPSYYWWHRFGKVLLGATHGDKAKMKDLPLVMAHDCPEDWAASTYRRIYTGHIHHESRIEEGGVIVTSMRSPTARDAYHSFNRWRAGRSVYSETFSSDGKVASSVTFNL